jgi:branched-chain amino acid transport system ATP-binding protein
VLENVRIALQRARALVRFLALARRCRRSTRARSSSSTRSGSREFARSTAVELPYGRKRALEIATTLALDPR